jgi:hypothetical protein
MEDTETLRRALDIAKAKRAKLAQQIEQAEKDMASLERTISGLCEVLGVDNEVERGLTEAIRFLFRINPGQILRPTDVREKLEEQGIRVTGKNPMANIHATLKRIPEEVEEAQLPDGSKGYRRRRFVLDPLPTWNDEKD